MELIEDLALHRQMKIRISFCLAQVLCPGISQINFWVAHELWPDSWHAAVAELPTMPMSSLGFQANMEGQLKKVWGGLHVSPKMAPSKRAKLCTYFALALRPSQLKAVPYEKSKEPYNRGVISKETETFC